MDLHTLSPSPAPRKNRRRVGRGPSSGHGKTSGRGHKGQKSRSGYSRKPGFEGGQMPLNRRLPKRGFRHAARYLLIGVNVDVLDAAFNEGEEITSEVLLARHLLSSNADGVKVLGRGEVTKKLTLNVSAISTSAREKIEAAGGSVTILEVPVARAVKNRTKGKSKEGK